MPTGASAGVATASGVSLALLLAACPQVTASPRGEQAAAEPTSAAPPRPAASARVLAELRDQVPTAVDLVHPLPDAQVPLFVPGQDFSALPTPTPGDWLAEHPEPGQTFAQYVKAEPHRPGPPRTTIYLQPLGALDSGVFPEAEAMARFAGAYFGLPARVLPSLRQGELKVKQRKNPWSGRRQLLATELLAQLRPRLPADAYCLVGLTAEDLYPEESWNFVFGMASLRERVGVFSFVRYDPAFYGAAPTEERRARTLRRSLKVVAHEIGHMFGMGHCTHFSCLMNGVNNLDEADRTPPHLCPVCLRKLQWNTGTDLAARYRALERLYGELGLSEEAAWIRGRLETVSRFEASVAAAPVP